MPETQELEARILPLIGAGLAGLSGLSSLFRGRDLELEAREPEPETQELEARILPLIGAGLAGLSGLSGLFRGRDLELDAREPDTQELEARVLPLLVPGIAAALTGVAAGAPLIPLLQRPRRELGPEARDSEPETQELEARILPLILPGLAAAAAVAPLLPGFPRPKRELSDDLFSREPQALDEAYYQDLNARVLPALLPAITNGLSGLSAITPLIPSFVNRQRELSDDLSAREPQDVDEVYYQDLDARVLPALLPAITNGLSGLSAITPLIPSFVNRPKREPSPEPQFIPTMMRFPPTHPPFRFPVA